MEEQDNTIYIEEQPRLSSHSQNWVVACGWKGVKGLCHFIEFVLSTLLHSPKSPYFNPHSMVHSVKYSN